MAMPSEEVPEGRTEYDAYQVPGVPMDQPQQDEQVVNQISGNDNSADLFALFENSINLLKGALND